MSQPSRPAPDAPQVDGRSDWKVVLQFFLVPLSLVVVLVALFFGLQLMRAHRPDASSALRDLERYEGFLARYVGDLKRWQSGYDLSLLMKAADAPEIRRRVPELIAAFREAGARGDLKLRRYLTLAIGQAADPAAAGVLREALDDPDAEIRVYACWGLWRIGGAGVLPDLRTAMADADPGVRQIAMFASGRLGDREAAPALREGLGDPVVEVRWNAALALAQIGDSAAAPVLGTLLEETIAGPPPSEDRAIEERRERARNAIRGLALLKSPGSRPVLEKVAASAGDSAIVEAARLALQEIGGAAGERVPQP